MDKGRYLSEDGLAALAVCSGFALRPGDPEPLRLAEWNQLARRVHNSGWKRPAALQGRSAGEIASKLSLPEKYAARLAGLLDRSSWVTLQLENIRSRGIWAMSRGDEQYPARLRRTLKQQSPVILFGAGEPRCLNDRGVAIVGSRDIDERGATFASALGAKVATAGFAVISGGARGTDRLAMEGALEAGGVSIGALAESLESTLLKRDVQRLVGEGQLVLVTPQTPDAGFSIAAAMARNKVIYALAEFAVVVSSAFQAGGTWVGASLAVKENWCPVFAREGKGVPAGNRELIRLGAAALPEDAMAGATDIISWMSQHSPRRVEERELL